MNNGIKYRVWALILIVCFFATIMFSVSSSAATCSASNTRNNAALSNAIIMCIGSPNAYVNGTLSKIAGKNPKVAPAVINKQTYIPLLFICDCLYGKYGMDTTSTVTVYMSEKEMVFKNKSSIVMVCGKKTKLEAPAITSNGYMYVPLKGLSSLIGKKFFSDRGLVVISDKDKILDKTKDASLITQLISKIKAGKEQKISFASASEGSSVKSPDNSTVTLTLEKYTFPGVFTIQKPKGWSVYKGGEYQTIAYHERDNSEPLRQVYCFSQIGPVYTSQQQKNTEYNYVNYLNGYPVAWLDMPVISPFTPEEYVKNLDGIFNSTIARGFFKQYNMPGMVEMQDLQVISKNEFGGAYPGTTSGVTRVLFKHGDKVAEGLFFVTVLADAYGHGTGYTVSAITAPVNEFNALLPILLKSFESFKLEDSYIKAGMQAIEENGEALKSVSKTISETGDILTKDWNTRQKPDDAMSQKKSDEMLGYERYYDSDSGEVYRVPLNSADAAQASGLERLEDDDYDRWLQKPVDWGFGS